jgi:Resolvase, N terminal domain
MEKPSKELFRCAIYIRKSTEHNLDLEFNSLDAQREACEAYIKSQAHEGWRLIPTHYDDGAFSGASLERPGSAKSRICRAYLYKPESGRRDHDWLAGAGGLEPPGTQLTTASAMLQRRVAAGVNVTGPVSGIRIFSSRTTSGASHAPGPVIGGSEGAIARLGVRRNLHVDAFGLLAHVAKHPPTPPTRFFPGIARPLRRFVLATSKWHQSRVVATLRYSRRIR